MFVSYNSVLFDFQACIIFVVYEEKSYMNKEVLVD